MPDTLLSREPLVLAPERPFSIDRKRLQHVFDLQKLSTATCQKGDALANASQVRPLNWSEKGRQGGTCAMEAVTLHATLYQIAP